MRRVSIATLKLALLAVPALFVSRMFVLFVPFRRMAPLLGHLNVQTSTDATHDPVRVKRIGAVLRKLARYLPWRCLCFEQALAGMMLLKVNKLAGTIYFGVHKGGDKMQAHAWLRCGDQIITGAAGHERFTVLFTVASRLPGNAGADSPKPEVSGI